MHYICALAIVTAVGVTFGAEIACMLGSHPDSQCQYTCYLRGFRDGFCDEEQNCNCTRYKINRHIYPEPEDNLQRFARSDDICRHGGNHACAVYCLAQGGNCDEDNNCVCMER